MLEKQKDSIFYCKCNPKLLLSATTLAGPRVKHLGEHTLTNLGKLFLLNGFGWGCLDTPEKLTALDQTL